VRVILNFQILKIIIVFVSVPLFAQNKVNVAVLDLEGDKKEFSREDLMAVTSRFETELMKTGVFQILERRNMDVILQEQGFQQSGACNTSECQVEIGQLLGVEQIISGSITKMGNIITLNVKMVDVGSGQNKISHALDIKGDLELLMRGGCYEMAAIISGKKQPDKDHTVLTAEKSSVWPWIVGGVAITAGVVITIILLDKDDTPSNKVAIIE
jgi:TolB-like protein